MTAQPIISVVIPTYNREKYVADAIDSVFAQVDAPRFEVIVVDDGSTDGTAEILAGYAGRIRVIRQANAGVSAARNKGIKAARGRWIFLLDSDDLIRPETLRRLLNRARQDPALTVVYADAAFLRDDGTTEPVKRVVTPEGASPIVETFRSFPFSVGTAVVRRDAIIRAGLFKTSLRLAEDYELWGRLAVDGNFAYVPMIALLYRRHEGQTTQANLKLILWRYRVQQMLIAYYKRRGIEIPEPVRHEAMDELLIRAARRHYWARQVPQVAPLLLAAARIRRWDWRLWAYWLLSHLPKRVFDFIDRRRPRSRRPG